MNRPPPAVEPHDPAFRQLKEMYSFFKDATGTALRDENTPPPRYSAVRSVNNAVKNGPPALARAWSGLSPAQRDRMLELLLKYYCESRGNLDYDLSRIIFKNLRNDVLYSCFEDSQRAATADTPNLFDHFNMLLGLLMFLYSAPICAREFKAFEDLRCDVGKARALLSRAQGVHGEYEQSVLKNAEGQLNERLREVNAVRDEHLKQVKAAFALLYDIAALVPGFSEAHFAAVEVYFSQLDSGQQVAAIACVRAFVFAACEERAMRGEALNPDRHLAKVLVALHAHDIGHTLCAAHLASIVNYYKSQGAPSADVQHIHAVYNRFCGKTWTTWFPQFALSLQVHVVKTMNALLGRLHPLTARQALHELAVILPMHSANPIDWEPAPTVDDPPVLLHSLAHSASTHHARYGAHSTSSATSSRYFPQARSARW